MPPVTAKKIITHLTALYYFAHCMPTQIRFLLFFSYLFKETTILVSPIIMKGGIRMYELDFQMNADKFYCPCCKRQLPLSQFKRSALLCDDCYLLQITRTEKSESKQEDKLER